MAGPKQPLESVLGGGGPLGEGSRRPRGTSPRVHQVSPGVSEFRVANSGQQGQAWANRVRLEYVNELISGAPASPVAESPRKGYYG